LPKPSSTSPLKTDNVQMNNVLPGWIEGLPSTGGRRDSMSMKRCGTSEETAATIACLASEGAGYITGQNLRVMAA
jgi:NAD(P)-dependent dehydrogenase (short-subunit alcohol dehydrogenase family)